MKAQHLLVLLFIFCLFSGSTAVAGTGAESQTQGGFALTDGEGLSLGIAVGMGDSAYKSYGASISPLPLVYYEGEYVYLRGTSAGVKLLDLRHLEVSAFLGYDATSFDSGHSENYGLRRLDNRYSTLEAGLEMRAILPFGMVFTSAAGDVLGNSNGFRGTAGYAISWEFGDFEFAPSAGIYWSTAKYNDYYYGVSDSESHKSGLASYDAGAGVKPYVSATLSYEITENWSAFCNAEVQFLNSTIKNSPMVGKSRTHSGMVGLLYSF